MRLIASVMGLLAMLCICFFIGGLIIGDPGTWGLGIGGFALCCIIGPVAQYISDRANGVYDAKIQTMVDNLREQARRNRLAAAEKASTEKRASHKSLVQRFDENYARVEALPKQRRTTEHIMQDEAGRLLLDLCASMPYAPRRDDIFKMLGLVAIKTDGRPSIYYIISPAGAVCIEYLCLCIVREKDGRLRLFSLELSPHYTYLCEFANGSHINYGDVRLPDMPDRIEQILREEA